MVCKKLKVFFLKTTKFFFNQIFFTTLFYKVVPFTLFSELVPTAHRGQSLVTVQTFWAIGSIYVPIAAMLFLPKTVAHVQMFNSQGWRYLIMSCSIPTLLMIPIMFFLPESPYYLMVHNKTEEAEKVMAKIAYYNERVVDFELIHENEASAVTSPSVVNSISVQQEENTSEKTLQKTTPWFIDLFRKKYIVITLLTCGLFVCGSFSYYGIGFLTPTFFEAKSSGPYDIYISSILAALSEFPGQIIAYFLIGRLGRKFTLLVLYGISAVSLFLLLVPFMHYTILTALVCTARAGIMGSTSLNWVIVPESFPTTLRNTALGVFVAAGRISSSTTPFITNLLASKNSSLPAIIIFGCACTIASAISVIIPVSSQPRGLEQFDKDEILKQQLTVPESPPMQNQGAGEDEPIIEIIEDDDDLEKKKQAEIAKQGNEEKVAQVQAKEASLIEKSEDAVVKQEVK